MKMPLCQFNKITMEQNMKSTEIIKTTASTLRVNILNSLKDLLNQSNTASRHLMTKLNLMALTTKMPQMMQTLPTGNQEEVQN